MENTYSHNNARRRVQSIRDHILTNAMRNDDDDDDEQKSLSNVNTRRTTNVMTMHRTSTNTYASATGKPTSYEKMHGYVSQEPIEWEECVRQSFHTFLKPILEEVFEKSKIEDAKKEVESHE